MRQLRSRNSHSCFACQLESDKYSDGRAPAATCFGRRLAWGRRRNPAQALADNTTVREQKEGSARRLSGAALLTLNQHGIPAARTGSCGRKIQATSRPDALAPWSRFLGCEVAAQPRPLMRYVGTMSTRLSSLPWPGTWTCSKGEKGELCHEHGEAA